MLSARTTLIKRTLQPSGYQRWARADKPAKRDLTEEKNMAPPPCPQPQSVDVITGFITPATDTAAPNSFAGGITVSVIDTVENEVVRILESADAFTVQVEWCICGQLIQAIDGCWNVSLYTDDIDGGTPRTTGQLGTTQQVAVTSVPLTSVPGPESFQRCYSLPINFPGGTVVDGVYNLLVVITLSTGPCTQPPGPLVGDLLGYAEIPVLVFYTD
jgi:hypothetical protein